MAARRRPQADRQALVEDAGAQEERGEAISVKLRVEVDEEIRPVTQRCIATAPSRMSPHSQQHVGLPSSTEYRGQDSNQRPRGIVLEEVHLQAEMPSCPQSPSGFARLRAHPLQCPEDHIRDH